MKYYTNLTLCYSNSLYHWDRIQNVKNSITDKSNCSCYVVQSQYKLIPQSSMLLTNFCGLAITRPFLFLQLSCSVDVGIHIAGWGFRHCMDHVKYSGWDTNRFILCHSMPAYVFFHICCWLNSLIFCYFKNYITF